MGGVFFLVFFLLFFGREYLDGKRPFIPPPASQ